jgi:hypothetical protein
VISVIMSWSSSIGSGSKPMTDQGGTYSAVLGPFDAEANPNVALGQFVTVTVTITVTDSLGRQANGQTTVKLNDCTFG